MPSARLVEEIPHIEVKDGLLYLEATDGSRFVMSLQLANAITRRSAAVLANEDIARRSGTDNVVPLCELCRRYDLPKHDEHD